MMTQTPAHLSEMHPFEYKMRHFVEVARGVRYNEVPPEHGLMVQQMLDAVNVLSPESLLKTWMPLAPQSPEQMRDAMSAMFRMFTPGGGGGMGMDY